MGRQIFFRISCWILRLLLNPKWILKAVVPFVGILAASCSDSDLPDYNRLDKLRVLGLVADNGAGAAEVSPGDSVTITPIISGLNSTGPIHQLAKVCFLPTLGYGAEPRCEGVVGAKTLSDQDITTLTAADSYTGLADSFVVNVPAEILLGASTVSQYNGLPLLVTYDISSADGQRVSSFQRVIVSTKTQKNNNPVVSDVVAAGVPLSSFPFGATVMLKILLGSPGIESYGFMNTDQEIQTRTESLFTTWYITDGELKFFRTENEGEVELVPPAAAPAGRKSQLIVITRDGRGGASAKVFRSN